MSVSSDDTSCGTVREVSRSDTRVHFEWTPILRSLSSDLYQLCKSPKIRVFDCTWSFTLYQNGLDSQFPDWISVCLCRHDPLKRNVLFTIAYELAGRIEWMAVSTGVFEKNARHFRMSKLFSRSNLLEGGSELSGQLTIICELCTMKEEWPILNEKVLASRETQTEEQSGVTGGEENGADQDTKVDSTLQKHLKDLLLTGDDHDVAIKVGNQEFRAHKNMLRARSPVFAAMFKHEMKEGEDGTIRIDDCDPEAFGEFLNYVYTGKVEDLSPKKATGLYYAGDKYDFSGLKEVCVQFLEASLSKTSVCDVINLATRHGEKGLLESAIKFFTENTKEILITVEWHRFAANNFVAANELFLRAIDAFDKNKK